jgi:adenylate kinase family enzyme
MKPRLERVMVVGTSCCGKTAFSKVLAELLKCPRIELDALYWGPNWQAKRDAEFRRLAEEAVLQDRWVVDGNYSALRDVTWPRATAVIWLNYNFSIVFWRGLVRSLRRSLLDQELFSGNRETLKRTFFSRDSILWWIIKTFKQRRRTYRRMLETRQFPELEWIELRTPAEAEEFIQAIRSSTLGAEQEAIEFASGI